MQSLGSFRPLLAVSRLFAKLCLQTLSSEMLKISAKKVTVYLQRKWSDRSLSTFWNHYLMKMWNVRIIFGLRVTAWPQNYSPPPLPPPPPPPHTHTHTRPSMVRVFHKQAAVFGSQTTAKEKILIRSFTHSWRKVGVGDLTKRIALQPHHMYNCKFWLV